MTLHILTSMAPEAFVRTGVEQLGLDAQVESMGGSLAEQRLRDGEAADIVVLAGSAIERLATQCVVEAAESRVLFESETVVAVPTGGARPVITTEEQLRGAASTATAIGISTGPSGAGIRRLLEQWQVRTPVVVAEPGRGVASLLSAGRAGLGFQQRSELEGRSGVVVLGAMPPGCEIRTTFVGAVTRATRHHDQACAAVERLASLHTMQRKHP